MDWLACRELLFGAKQHIPFQNSPGSCLRERALSLAQTGHSVIMP